MFIAIANVIGQKRNKSSAIQYFVRPSGTTYGDGSGTSYDNAWSGFTSINWTLLENQTLNVCGTHTETLTVQANCTIEMGNIAEAGYIDADTLEFGIYIKDFDITGKNLFVENAKLYSLPNKYTANIYYENSTSVIYNAISNNCENQGFQHWSGANVTYHGNIISNNNNDEGISGHLDSVIILAEDCHFESKNNYQAGINVTNDTNITINGTLDFSNNGTGATVYGDILLTGDSICTINSDITLSRIFLSDRNIINVNAGNYGTIYLFNNDSICNINSCAVDIFTNLGGTINANNCIINNYTMTKGTLNLSDSYVLLNSTFLIDGAGTANITRCLFENGTNIDQMIDNVNGNLNIDYSILKGCVAGKWSIISRATSLSNIVNNVVIDALGIGRGIAYFKTTNVEYNNLIITNVTNAFGVVVSGVTMTINNCILFNFVTKNASSGTLSEVNSLYTNPQFTDTANDDYSTPITSLAFESGVTIANNVGILSADWTIPSVTTKNQGASFNRGAYVN